jgi:uncharacterized membrane protein
LYWGASEPLPLAEGQEPTVDFAKVQASAQENGGIVILGPPPFPDR